MHIQELPSQEDVILNINLSDYYSIMESVTVAEFVFLSLIFLINITICLVLFSFILVKTLQGLRKSENRL